jgi:hypothetical protein
VLAGLLEPFLSGRGLHDPVTLVGEAAADHRPNLRIVVDDQDACGVAHAWYLGQTVSTLHDALRC